MRAASEGGTPVSREVGMDTLQRIKAGELRMALDAQDTIIQAPDLVSRGGGGGQRLAPRWQMTDLHCVMLTSAMVVVARPFPRGRAQHLSRIQGCVRNQRLGKASSPTNVVASTSCMPVLCTLRHWTGMIGIIAFTEPAYGLADHMKHDDVKLVSMTCKIRASMPVFQDGRTFDECMALFREGKVELPGHLIPMAFKKLCALNAACIQP